MSWTATGGGAQVTEKRRTNRAVTVWEGEGGERQDASGFEGRKGEADDKQGSEKGGLKDSTHQSKGVPTIGKKVLPSPKKKKKKKKGKKMEGV